MLTLLRSRGFHSTALCGVRAKYLKKLNRLHKHWAKQLFRPQAEYVDPVLGRPNTPFIERINALVKDQFNQVHGLESERTSQLLFGAEKAAQKAAERALESEEKSEKQQDRLNAHANETEERKRQVLMRIISLSNSNMHEHQRLARRHAMSEFARFEGDTGSSEVQAAVLTIKIHYLAKHVKETKKDVASKRKLEHLVQTRRNMLLYLRKVNPERYVWTIEKLGLSDESVQAEFHMSKNYLFKTQFYGERTLPLKKTKKDTEEHRKAEVKRQKALDYLAKHQAQSATV